ncbi:hypothetical protein NMY22_g12593 [Coprinellus aureogranulatus]|nr:hypothetical protein NMY22_g12593 [Coprinellus aureogranulatus]
MASQTPSCVLRPCQNWDYDSDSSLTDLTDTEDEQEVEQPPPQRIKRARPVPSDDKDVGEGPSTTRQGRTTRQTSEKAKEEDLGAVNDRDQGPLPPFTQTPTKVDDVYEWMCEGLVDICPDYQRDVVWNDAKQMNLIDSIFQNYPVPNLVFVRRFKNGDYYRVCIDGKQRLTSIKRFMDGEIFYKDPYVSFGAVYPVNHVDTNVHIRVQLGTVLTPAERLQAVNGICATLVREVRDHVCGLTVFSNFSEWGGNRGRDFLALAQIVFLVKSGKLPATLPEPDKLTPFLEGKAGGGNIDILRDGIKHSFTIFARLLSHPQYGRILTEKEISPVEFVVAVHAISALKKRYTDCEIADALKKIWGHARDKSTAKKKATKSSSGKAYVDMRNFFERVQGGKVPLERDMDAHTKAADIPIDQILQMDVQQDNEPVVEERQATSRKRLRAQASSSAGIDEDDDDIPLSRKKAEKKAPAPKKQKLMHRAKQEADSDEDTDSDDSTEIVAAAPKRSETSRIAIRKPSQVGTRPTTSPAATRCSGSQAFHLFSRHESAAGPEGCEAQTPA